RRRSWRGGNIDLLEEAQVLQTFLAAAHLRRREGVAFGETEFAPDHLVEGAGVAGDVDALDIDPRTFLDTEGDIDRVRFPVAMNVRANLDKGVTQSADRVRHGRDGLLDFVGVVPVAFLHRQVALQRIDIEALEACSDVDLAKLVALALMDGEGEEKATAIRC